MKRLLCLLIACLVVFSGCASAPETDVTEMLGTMAGSTYSSPFGFVIDLEGMTVQSEEVLAAMNQLEGGAFTADALMDAMEKGIAVGILSASGDRGYSSMTLSLIPASELPGTIRDAVDYAEYSLSGIPGKLEGIGCTDIRVQRINVTIDGVEHPAVLCSCKFVDGSPYHLLQVCFSRGEWMSGLSLTSLESEEALRQLLNRVTSTN